jgi:hypothetical protein
MSATSLPSTHDLFDRDELDSVLIRPDSNVNLLLERTLDQIFQEDGNDDDWFLFDDSEPSNHNENDVDSMASANFLPTHHQWSGKRNFGAASQEDEKRPVKRIKNEKARHAVERGNIYER